MSTERGPPIAVGWVMQGGVGHAGVRWCGACRVGVGWVMQGWGGVGHAGMGLGGSYRGGMGRVMKILKY